MVSASLARRRRRLPWGAAVTLAGMRPAAETVGHRLCVGVSVTPRYLRFANENENLE
jgi:hypothetical protein